MRREAFLGALVALVVAAAAPAAASAEPHSEFSQVIGSILDQPYQPDYVPVGFDLAFPQDSQNMTPVPNTLPAQDYTSGSIPGDPDHPNWPASFTYVTKAQGLVSGDGAPLRGRLAIQPVGSHPGVVVAHGFNTNGKESVIRWAAMLYANGFNVLAADQRDFKDENDNGEGQPTWRQTFGWKEAEDILAAGAYLKSRAGVTSVGVVGFSEGAQNVILALAHDTTGIFSAGLTFSPPADQNAQIYSTAAPPGCQPPNCEYPVTDALISLVVPPFGHYTDPCPVLVDAGTTYGTTPAAILNQERAFLAQQSVTVPLLNFYANDDSLVAPFQATMMAGYERGKALQKTYLIQRGEHAYFFDRWWDQKAILLYFHALLPGAGTDLTIHTDPTVLPGTPAGQPLRDQLVDLGNPAPGDGDPHSPLICPSTPTAVTLQSISAARLGPNVVVRWRTASEAGLLGFDLYRAQGTQRVRLGGALIPARGGTRGALYTFRDRLAPTLRGTRYWLEAVRLDGSRVSLGPVRAR